MWYSNIYICEYYLTRINSIHSNVDESGGHYSMWNKSDTERQIIYGVIYVES